MCLPDVDRPPAEIGTTVLSLGRLMWPAVHPVPTDAWASSRPAAVPGARKGSFRRGYTGIVAGDRVPGAASQTLRPALGRNRLESVTRELPSGTMERFAE